jgi:hypothetical protein
VITEHYSPADIDVLALLNQKIRGKIQTGSMKGMKSRSERDWGVVMGLVRAGASDELIYRIFKTMPIGDKYRDRDTPDQYLPHTIERARKEHTENPPKSKKGTGQSEPVQLVERENQYFVIGKSVRRVSTFVIVPRMLLDGSHFDSEDAIVGDVVAGERVWTDITFPRSAFASTTQMDKHCPKAAWQWLGTDGEVRLLLPHLLEKLQADGLPSIAASPVLGLHTVEGETYFLGDQQTVSAETVWQGHEGPLAWLPSRREHATLDLTANDFGFEDFAILRDLLPKINEQHVVWTMLGWYAATVFKPWLEKNGVRFPILNVTGTKGSGKTTLIKSVFMPLFGQTDPKTYDAGTTRFVVLALLGSSNAVPVAFSEFRHESVEKFLRYILLAYDTGNDPRGRADQTTVNYPLTAPFSVDGEDPVDDGAVRERVVVARLRPGTIAEKTPAYAAFKELRDEMPPHFAGYYIQRCLQMMKSGEAFVLLQQARHMFHVTYPDRMPDRIRNNYIVAYFGALVFCDVVGLDKPLPAVFRESIQEVCNLGSATGRSRSQVDEFVEAIVNAVDTSSGNLPFKWAYDSTARVLHFSLTPAHSWWLRGRRQSGRSALERDAIRNQLIEAGYADRGQIVENSWMYGIRLEDAVAEGLDIPNELHPSVLRVVTRKS